MNETNRDSTATEPLREPVVAEVRAIRERLVAEAGGTLDGLFAMLRTREAKRGGTVVTLPPRPPELATDAA